MKFRIPLVTALVLSSIVGAASAGQNWQGVQVMPNSAQVQIQDDNGASVSMYDIGWPATVQRTKGRFLWVQDEGGYSRNLAGGWIYTDDVVKLDDAHDYYTGELRRGESAWLDWMCGISWESKGEPGIAMQYYQNVFTVEPNSRLDDAHIRMGRLLAQQQLLNGRGRYNPAQRETWEQHFENAQNINPNRPQLYYEWGLALTQACACTQAKILAAQQASLAAQAGANSTSNDSPANSVTPGNQPLGRGTATSENIAPGVPAGPTTAGAEAAIQSLAYYERAEQLNPRWWRIPLARAELMLDQCDQESTECPGERALAPNVKPEFFTQLVTHCHRKSAHAGNTPEATPTMTSNGGQTLAESNSKNPAPAASEAAIPPYMNDVLAIALDDFNRSISLNANALDAYRDRAEVLRLTHRLDEAEQSATKACALCYYRQAGSLRTLAQVNHDLQLYQPAADYALRAAELAGGDEQQRYLKLWYKCCQQCSDDTAKIAVASAQAGYVASRGGDDDAAENPGKAKPPAHIEPPPGFLSRAANAVPD